MKSVHADMLNVLFSDTRMQDWNRMAGVERLEPGHIGSQVLVIIRKGETSLFPGGQGQLPDQSGRDQPHPRNGQKGH